MSTVSTYTSAYVRVQLIVMEEGRGMDWAKTIGGRQKGFLLSPPSVPRR